MSFGGLILTNQGRNMIAAAISNEKALDFTHVQLGDGTYNDSYLSKKELTSMVMEIPVTRVTRRNSEVTIDCDWNSSQAPRGFYFREIGIIGNGVLCYYDNAGIGEAEYIDPESDMVSKEKRIRLTVVVSNDVNVTVNTASSLYALSTELDELDKKKVNESDIYEWARNQEKPTYSKEEIGLDNVDNTADKDKPLSTAMQEAIQAVYENANQFTLAKIAELINGAPATADTLKEIADLITDNKSVVDALDSAIGKKANQTELDTHTGNGTIHITASERTKWNNVDNKLDKNYAVVANGTNLNSIFNTGLYFCNSSYTYTNLPSGVVNGYLVVMRNGTTNNIKQVFYRQGTTGTNDWQIYVRTGTTTSFGAWVRLITEKDTATASVAGLTKLYTSTGTSTDGTMTQKAITEQISPTAFATCGVAYNGVSGYYAVPGSVDVPKLSGKDPDVLQFTITCSTSIQGSLVFSIDYNTGSISKSVNYTGLSYGTIPLTISKNTSGSITFYIGTTSLINYLSNAYFLLKVESVYL